MANTPGYGTSIAGSQLPGGSDYIPPSPVNVSLTPSTTTNTNVLSAPPITTQDIQSLLTENQKFQQQVLGYISPTADETAVGTRLNTLQTEGEQLQANVNDQIMRLGVQPGVTTGVASAQQAEASRQGQYRLQTNAIQQSGAARTLQALQSKRQGLLQAAQLQAQYGQQTFGNVMTLQREARADAGEIRANKALELQLRQIENQEKAAALAYVTENNITKPYFMVGQEVRETSTLKPFSSLEDFQTRTGIPLSQAMAGGMVQTEIETQADRQFKLDQQKLEQGKWMSVTDPLTGGSVLVNPTTGEVLNPFGGGSPGVPDNVSSLQQEFNAVTATLPNGQRQNAARIFNGYVNSGNIDAAEAYINRLALDSLTSDQKRDYEAYDNALSVTSQVVGDMEAFKSTNFGPWKSITEQKKPWVGLEKDQTWVGITQQIEFAQAELKRALYGTALTATEKESADKFLITDNDDPATVLTKLQGLQGLMRDAKNRVINHAKGDFGPSESTVNSLESEWNSYFTPQSGDADFTGPTPPNPNASTRTFQPLTAPGKLERITGYLPVGKWATTNPAPFAVVGEYTQDGKRYAFDITRYATDKNHEKNVTSIFNKIPPDTRSSASAIDKYIKSVTKNSPVTGQMVLAASRKYGTPVRMILAIMQADSSFGTAGKAIWTKNPGNVGNTDSGATRSHKTWQSGVDAVAQLLLDYRTMIIGA